MKDFITIDNTGETVQVLVEYPQVKDVPINLGDPERAAEWLLEAYPEIQGIITEESPDHGLSPKEELMSVKLSLKIGIGLKSLANGGDIRATVEKMVKVHCNKMHERITLALVDMVAVASGVLTQEELDTDEEDQFMDSLVDLAERGEMGEDIEVELHELKMPKSIEASEHKSHQLALPPHMEMMKMIEDSSPKACSANPDNCPVCGEETLPAPETVDDVVSLLRDDNSDTVILDALLWAENQLKDSEEVTAKDLYNYAVGYIEQGGH